MNDTIESIAKKCEPVFDEIGFVDKAYLFGSYSKGTNKENSDIDIIVELNKPMDSKFFVLYPRLEEATSKSIDIYSINELDYRFLNAIRKDFKLIYERQKLDNV